MEAIRLSGFGFAYPGGQPVLHDIDISIQEGSFTLLVGSTGSGKTTLLRNLKPELVPTGERFGSIEVFGETVAPCPGTVSAACTGYVAQNPENQTVCDSVWHELAFGLENSGTPQEAMRRRVAEIAYFFGMESWFHGDTAKLSGGQKQMLALASVLAMQPRLLLLDEPTAQLDPVATRNFLHLLFRINRELGVTVLAATHAPEMMAEYATYCLCTQDGSVQAIGLEGFRNDGTAVARRVEVPDVPSAGEGGDARRLGAHEVFFRYARDGQWVARGASIEVAPGSIHVLVGGNGSGKTTLLGLLAGVFKPERGRVFNDCTSRQALLPQDPCALFVGDSVTEELGEWSTRCGYDDEARDEALAWAGLRGLEQRDPHDLSNGQQRKLALAKLSLTRARLLLLDEPTSGLDAPSRVEVARMLFELRDQGVTVVLATHDLPFALQVADRVSMLFDGEVTCTEDAAGFFSHNLLYRPNLDGFSKLWAAQGGTS